MTPNNKYRNVTIGELTEANIGETRRVAGWVENIRDHGGVSFLDVRDMYGVLQVVLRDTSLLDGITREMSISVEGPIEKRDEETYNPKIPTGTIEMEAKTIDVLGKVYKQLPFEIQTSKETREDVRLKYRYLDLRNPEMRDRVVLRSRVVAEIRRRMIVHDFLEISTPILTVSSPEGGGLSPGSGEAANVSVAAGDAGSFPHPAAGRSSRRRERAAARVLFFFIFVILL